MTDGSDAARLAVVALLAAFAATSLALAAAVPTWGSSSGSAFPVLEAGDCHPRNLSAVAARVSSRPESGVKTVDVARIGPDVSVIARANASSGHAAALGTGVAVYAAVYPCSRNLGVVTVAVDGERRAVYSVAREDARGYANGSVSSRELVNRTRVVAGGPP